MNSLFLLSAAFAVFAVITLLGFAGVLYITYSTWKESLECDEYPSEHKIED